MKGSRPILSFDAAFNGEPYLRLLRELLAHTFGVPPTARKAKAFIDRVLAFIVADGRIWVRHYQIAEEEDDASRDEKLSLREIGPREFRLRRWSHVQLANFQTLKVSV